MKISYRQMSIMVFMSFISVKLMALPGFMWEVSGNMSWFVTLVLMCIDGIFALIIADLMEKSGNKNIYEFMKETLGVVLAKIILACLIIKYAIVLAIIGKSLEFFILENLYEQFNWLYFGVPLMGVVGFMVYKGARDIARVFEFFWCPILFGCVYIAAKALGGVDLLAFLPMFKQGVVPLASSAFKHYAWFGSSAFLFLMFGQVDFKDKKKGNLIFFIFLAIAIVQLLNFVFYGLFGITSPLHQFCISDVSQFNSARSGISELSWLVVCLWIVAQVGHFALYGYCFVKAVMLLFNIKQKTVGCLFLYAYIVFWGIYGTHAINPEQLFYHPFSACLTIVCEYLITIILLIGYAIKNAKQNKQRLKAEVKNEKV